jgi:FlaA1/EpsC-like NDP-sugar epimerase
MIVTPIAPSGFFEAQWHMANVNRMKYLVTGAAGFIGNFVAQRLCQQGHEVVGLVNLNDYYDSRL